MPLPPLPSRRSTRGGASATATRRRIRRAALFLLAAASCREAPTPEFRIGLSALLSSRYANGSGIPSERGARMAVDELNAAGGVMIGGTAHRVRLIVRDFAERPDAAASAVRALVNLDSVHALVGPQFSAHSIPAGGVAEDAQVPLISPMSSNPALTQGRRFVFRLAFLDAFQGKMLARYACGQLSLRRAAMLYDAASPYGRDIAALFRETFSDCGGLIVADETFTTDRATDFTPQLRRIIASGADALLLPNYAREDSIQVRQARALGFRGRFLSADSWDPAGLYSIEEAIGTVVVGQWDWRLPSPVTQRFVRRYREIYSDSVPRATAALTYDAILLLADAARRVGTLQGDSLARAIAQTERFEGAGSTYRFAGRQDPTRGGVLLVMGRGRDSLISISADRP